MCRVPVCVLLTHISCIFVYDLDSPTGTHRWSPFLQALGLHLLVFGLLQAVLALLAASIVCPTLAAIVLVCKSCSHTPVMCCFCWCCSNCYCFSPSYHHSHLPPSDGVLRRGLRHVWDAVMFHVVIKKRGRIPASDSFLVKRIAGPGLHSNFYYQVGLGPVGT